MLRDYIEFHDIFCVFEYYLIFDGAKVSHIFQTLSPLNDSKEAKEAFKQVKRVFLSGIQYPAIKALVNNSFLSESQKSIYWRATDYCRTMLKKRPVFIKLSTSCQPLST